MNHASVRKVFLEKRPWARYSIPGTCIKVETWHLRLRSSTSRLQCRGKNDDMTCAFFTITNLHPCISVVQAVMDEAPSADQPGNMETGSRCRTTGTSRICGFDLRCDHHCVNPGRLHAAHPCVFLASGIHSNSSVFSIANTVVGMQAASPSSSTPRPTVFRGCEKSVSRPDVRLCSAHPRWQQGVVWPRWL